MRQQKGGRGRLIEVGVGIKYSRLLTNTEIGTWESGRLMEGGRLMGQHVIFSTQAL